MIKVDSNTMKTVLIMLKKPDEDIKAQIYARVKRTKLLTLPSMEYEDAYIGLTTEGNLLVVQFDIFNKPQVNSYPLLSLKKFKARPFIVGTYLVTAVFMVDGKKKKVEFTAAKTICGTDLDRQEDDLEDILLAMKRQVEDGQAW